MAVNVNIIETNLRFTDLSRRQVTDMIVIHHTGSVKDYDFSAAKVHEMHLGQGWAGIGYHFVIRKDGTIERGRPDWTVGSHTYGHNWHALGIHLSGDFNAAYPTDKQIEACAMLIAHLCEKYDIEINRKHIKGHGELDASVTTVGCPGKNLADKLNILSGKANWYHNTTLFNNISPSVKPDAVVKSVIEIRSNAPISDETIKKITDICKQSQCPNESMFSSIPNFKSFNNNGVVIIGNDGEYKATIEF